MFQTIVMMSNKVSIKIVHFMSPWAKVPVLESGQFCHTVKMHYSTPGHFADKLSKLSAYMQLYEADKPLHSF